MITLETIAAPENVARAIKRVRAAGGKSPGVGKLTTQHLRKGGQEKLYVELVSRKLLKGEWEFYPALYCEIPKGNGEPRKLNIPTTLDRVVEHAILGVIEPLWDPTFSPHSYAFRPNPETKEKLRGQHPAMWQMLAYMEQGATHLVDMDLAKFFDTMNRQRLFSLLRERIEDERIVRLIASRLSAGVMKDSREPTSVGVPQGGPLSPFLSNVYLDELDKTLTERGHLFVRYADDFRIFKFNRSRAKRAYKSVTRLLEEHLLLKVNREKSSVCSAHLSCFLGFEIRTHRGGIDVLVSAKARARREAKIAELEAKGDHDLIRYYWKGWLSYFEPLVTVKESLYW